MADPANHCRTSLYSAPRRFDVATIMVVTLAYAVLFGLLRLLRMSLGAVAVIAGFVTCVGLAQALLFGGKRPRLASIVISQVYIIGVYCYAAVLWDASPLWLMDPMVWLVWTVIAVTAAVVGYLTGAVIGSVFLLCDVWRGRRRLGDASGEGRPQSGP